LHIAVYLYLFKLTHSIYYNSLVNKERFTPQTLLVKNLNCSQYIPRSTTNILHWK